MKNDPTNGMPAPSPQVTGFIMETVCRDWRGGVCRRKTTTDLQGRVLREEASLPSGEVTVTTYAYSEKGDGNGIIDEEMGGRSNQLTD